MIPLKKIFKVAVCYMLLIVLITGTTYIRAHAATDISKIQPSYPELILINPVKPGPAIVLPERTIIIQTIPIQTEPAETVESSAEEIAETPEKAEPVTRRAVETSEEKEAAAEGQ